MRHETRIQFGSIDEINKKIFYTLNQYQAHICPDEESYQSYQSRLHGQ